jgi:hypothetical protein
MEKLLHEIDSIWKNYYIIKFPWNKYYAGTNISYSVYRSGFYKHTTLQVCIFYNRISPVKHLHVHCIITLALERTDSRSTMSIKNFFQFSANELIKGTKIYFSDFKGKVILVENVASL